LGHSTTRVIDLGRFQKAQEKGDEEELLVVCHLIHAQIERFRQAISAMVAI
jgi:hypothetical protein